MAMQAIVCKCLIQPLVIYCLVNFMRASHVQVILAWALAVFGGAIVF
jgi:hypothetical protein